MENEKIIEWLDRLAYRPEIVLESLKRAVLRGIYNFNYIDRILMEWQKSNLRTLNDIHKFESEKMNREKSSRKKAAPQVRSPKVKSIYEM
jgi:DNA replication protein